MPEIVVVTDCSSDMAPEKARALGIRQVPMTTYISRGASPLPALMTPASFWGELKAAGGPVRVAQPTPGDFHKTYRDILETSDPDVTILSIHAAGRFSGALHSAHLAAEMLSGSRIRVIDSGLVGPPLGQVVVETAALVGADHSAEEIMDVVYSLLSRIRVMVYAQDLGGLTDAPPEGWWHRMSRAAYRPFQPNLYTLREGEMTPVGRCPTVEDAQARFIEFIAEAERLGFVGILIAGEEPSDTDLTDHVDPATEVEQFIMGPVLGAHLGRGSMGVFTIG